MYERSLLERSSDTQKLSIIAGPPQATYFSWYYICICADWESYECLLARTNQIWIETPISSWKDLRSCSMRNSLSGCLASWNSDSLKVPKVYLRHEACWSAWWGFLGRPFWWVFSWALFKWSLVFGAESQHTRPCVGTRSLPSFRSSKFCSQLVLPNTQSVFAPNLQWEFQRCFFIVWTQWRTLCCSNSLIM